MKLTQDFLGCANRLREETSIFEEQVGALMEHWSDTTGRDFENLHLRPMSETLRRLMITLQQAAELSSKCGKMLSEEDA